jgi:hypothetical protein
MGRRAYLYRLILADLDSSATSSPRPELVLLC